MARYKPRQAIEEAARTAQQIFMLMDSEPRPLEEIAELAERLAMLETGIQRHRKEGGADPWAPSATLAACKGMIHHDDGLKPQYKIPKNLRRQIERAIERAEEDIYTLEK